MSRTSAKDGYGINDDDDNDNNNDDDDDDGDDDDDDDDDATRPSTLQEQIYVRLRIVYEGTN